MSSPFNILGQSSIRLAKHDDISTIDDIALVNYLMQCPSGTSMGQCNKIWYETRSIASTHNTDLLSLPFNRLGVMYNTSFRGAGDGNIKGLHIQNDGNSPLYFSFPFDGFTGYDLVPPSSSYLIANSTGFEVPASNATISASGSGTYTISMIGATMPLVLKLDNSFNIEYMLCKSVDGSTNFENLQSIDASSQGAIEWLKTTIDIDNSTNIEYMQGLSFDKVSNIEGLLSRTFDKQVNFENDLANSMNNELLQNIEFYPTDSGLVDSNWNEINPSSVDPWSFQYDEHITYQQSDLSYTNITFNNSFAVYRNIPDGFGGFLNNVAVLSSESPSSLKMSQVVYNITPSQNYRATFEYESEIGLVAPTGTFTIKDESTPIVVAMQDNTGISASDGAFRYYSKDILPTGSTLTLEWYIPQQQLTYDSTISEFENISKYRNTWFIKSPH